jgi:hypothetical protein
VAQPSGRVDLVAAARGKGGSSSRSGGCDTSGVHGDDRLDGGGSRRRKGGWWLPVTSDPDSAGGRIPEADGGAVASGAHKVGSMHQARGSLGSRATRLVGRAFYFVNFIYANGHLSAWKNLALHGPFHASRLNAHLRKGYLPA